MFDYVKMMLTLYVPSADESEEGQGMVEYALILALVSIVAIGVLVLIGPQIADVFQEVVDKLPGDGE